MTEIAEIEQKVTRVILANLPDLPPEKLLNDAELFSLGLNSLNTVPLVLGLEEAFEFEFESDEISYDSFQSVASISNLIASKLTAV